MAQTDYFLKLDGIDGESTDDMFPKWIELTSWSWSTNNTSGYSNTGSSGTGKVTMADLICTALTSAASPSIAQYAANGKTIATAELDCRKAGDPPQVNLVIKLTNVLVSRYQTGGAHGADAPTDTFALNYAKIEYSYGKQGDNGKVASLDQKMNFDLRKLA